MPLDVSPNFRQLDDNIVPFYKPCDKDTIWPMHILSDWFGQVTDSDHVRTITFNVKGWSKEEITVTIQGLRLEVTGTKPNSRLYWGSVMDPRVDPESLTAKLEGEVLTISYKEKTKRVIELK